MDDAESHAGGAFDPGLPLTNVPDVGPGGRCGNDLGVPEHLQGDGVDSTGGVMADTVDVRDCAEAPPQFPWAAAVLFAAGSVWTVVGLAAGHAVHFGGWLTTMGLCTATVVAIVVGGAVRAVGVRIVVAGAALILCLAGISGGGVAFLPACLALVAEMCLLRPTDQDVLTERRAVSRDARPF